jgi:hypothetical protein
MADIPDFQQKQYDFAAHIRDPEHAPAPAGVEDRRMAVYRNLFFNNISSLLATTFPVIKKIVSKDKWNGLIRAFMQVHHSQTPYFLQLPQEFLDFLQNEYEMQEDDYPFLIELAHYENVELALSISEAVNDLTGVDPDGDLLANVPVKSKLAWAFAYQFPVHRIAPTFLPTQPGEQTTFLAVYRDANDRLGFLELNAVTAGLLDLIESNPDNLTGEQLLRSLAETTQFPDADAFVQHGLAALEEMRQLQILTGTRAA